MVYLPRGGLKSATPDVSMFFHGNGADFKTMDDKDNSVKSARLAEAVGASGRQVIALAPFSGKNPKTGKDAEWQALAAGSYRTMIDEVLVSLGRDLLMTTPLKAGAVSLIGHSGGGRALGQAAIETGATEVTLQDAGYGKFNGEVSVNYTSGWDKLGRWFLTGQAPKTLRVLTCWGRGTGDGDNSTRFVLENKISGFSVSALEAQMGRLVKEGALVDKLTLTKEGGDASSVRDGDMKLESRLVARKPDGTLQGTLHVFFIQASHGGVRDKSMAAALRGGGDDFGKPAPGDFEVVADKAYVRTESNLALRAKRDGADIVIPKGDKVRVTDRRAHGREQYGLVEGHGWTLMSNLKSTDPARP